MSILGNYKFTNKVHPLKGIMSAVLGMIAVISMGLSIYFSYLDGGTTKLQYGAAAVLAFFMGIAGEILGLMANAQKDCYRFFPLLGLLLNTIVLFGGVYILYASI